nr:hypothetical protein Iba_chr04dCG1760 [Ipomoea batatas]
MPWGCHTEPPSASLDKEECQSVMIRYGFKDPEVTEAEDAKLWKSNYEKRQQLENELEDSLELHGQALALSLRIQQILICIYLMQHLLPQERHVYEDADYLHLDKKTLLNFTVPWDWVWAFPAQLRWKAKKGSFGEFMSHQ